MGLRDKMEKGTSTRENGTWDHREDERWASTQQTDERAKTATQEKRRGKKRKQTRAELETN